MLTFMEVQEMKTERAPREVEKLQMSNSKLRVKTSELSLKGEW
jgi:hypothetical protein